MARTASTRYTAAGTAFEYASADGDALLPEDIWALALAVEQHTHDATRGDPVRRINTSDAPGAAGQVRVNGDLFQWWGTTSGAVLTAVSLAGNETLTNKTLVTPTIPSFVNANHTHAAGAGGGLLDWDLCWTDAVHSHQSDAEGGALDGAAITGSVTGSGSVVKATAPTITNATFASPSISSPTITTLTVSAGGIAVTSGGIAFGGDLMPSDAAAQIRSGATSLAIRNNADSADLVHVTNGGNVGVGVTPGAWHGSYSALQIGTSGALVALNAAGPGFQVRDNTRHNGTNHVALVGGAAASYIQQSAGIITLSTAPSVANAGDTQTFTERLSINASGQWTVSTVAGVTVGAAGGAAALPATPLGYMSWTVNGTAVKIPYYNP